jgi:hypothetical protein
LAVGKKVFIKLGRPMILALCGLRKLAVNKKANKKIVCKKMWNKT